jgi:branched-chain amino acid transport system ATP-binding protein
VTKILDLEGLQVHYGELIALKGISLHLQEGEIVALLGANGAGKSTTLKTISGLLRPTSGSIRFHGEEITKLSPHQVVQKGIAHAPEGRAIVPHFSVKENLLVGAYTEKKKKRVEESLEKVFQQFPVLRERFKQMGGTLSGGEQQMLSIGRAMMSNPEVLLLDEPSLGLAPLITEQIFLIIRNINRLNTSVLLVEQNAYAALELAHRGYILEVGAITLEGNAAELKDNEEVKKKYLGG